MGLHEEKMNGKNYQYVLFDLDGTLTDSVLGVINGFSYVIKKMGKPVPPESTLRKFVGPPLIVSFGKHLGYPPEQAEKAVEMFREYYNEMGGALENRVYPGVEQLLADLNAAGKKLIVATSKGTRAANIVLDHFDLRKYFVFAATADDIIRPRKVDVIRYALQSCGVTDLTKAVMVGDREHDVLAANEVGLDSIGVLYGYGSREELTAAGATYLAATPADVKAFTE